MSGEMAAIVLFIVLFGSIAFCVASGVGKKLAKRRREQFGDEGWGDEWRK